MANKRMLYLLSSPLIQCHVFTFTLWRYVTITFCLLNTIKFFSTLNLSDSKNKKQKTPNFWNTILMRTGISQIDQPYQISCLLILLSIFCRLLLPLFLLALNLLFQRKKREMFHYLRRYYLLIMQDITLSTEKEIKTLPPNLCCGNENFPNAQVKLMMSSFLSDSLYFSLENFQKYLFLG